ncbi:MAG: PglZ domain-containing protein [Planctomycetota bacterium]
MKIKSYIQNEIIKPRLNKSGVLVVYDASNRYQELCTDLADEQTVVVDTSEGSIASRELAIKTFQGMGKPNTQTRLLVYVPTAAPDTSQKKMVDPFWIYAEAGSFFPRKSGDEFDQICLTAKSDHATEIRKVFADNPNPTFELIDNIGGGAGWPTLQAVLDAESTREIIRRLLVPKEAQQEKLNSDQPWVPEARQLLKRGLGMELQTQQESWSTISDEMWRFILFSEFVFDLPEGTKLPSALAPVPCAIPQAKPLIYEVCDQLRSSLETQPVYIERAQEIEEVLELRKRCGQISDLGERDTFPFEERSFFTRCVTAIQNDDLDEARAILKRNEGSVWIGRGESQSQWNIIESVVRLVEKCQDCKNELSQYTATQEKLIFFYLDQFYKVDQYHREFEHAVGDHFDISGSLSPAIEFARKTYYDLASQVQSVFVKHLESTGWPPSGMLSSTEIFDSHVAPRLKESGKKVAYFMIDALRYELGTQLEQELADESNTELKASFSVIPTVTPIGMTSLLPEAQTKLRLEQNGNDVAVFMGDTQIKTVDHRMKWIETRYGGRFKQIKLEEVLKPSFEKKLDDHVELLVIRSSSVDARMETEYQSGLPAIKKDMQAIRVAIYRLREAGFEYAVIATDHGFCINAVPDVGDTCQKPSGDWKTLHDRCLLGKGAGNTSNWVCLTEHLGLKTDYDQIGGPKSLACYTQNNQYFHGGASLQEAVVPCLLVTMKKAEEEQENITFSINYKNGATKVTTRLPVLELEARAGDLFSSAEDCDVLLQAISDEGKVVGEPKPGGAVNPATGTISLRLGTSAKVPLKMSAEFEGAFTLTLLDPATRAQLAELKLETDYMV